MIQSRSFLQSFFKWHAQKSLVCHEYPIVTGLTSINAIKIRMDDTLLSTNTIIRWLGRIMISDCSAMEQAL
jgi:hypothetical protein